MPGLLLLTALGHRGTKNPHELENLVAAGHGFYAHADNTPYSGHEAIDEAQHVVSDVFKNVDQTPQVIIAKIPSVASSISHTWMSAETKLVHPGDALLGNQIPHVHGWF